MKSFKRIRFQLQGGQWTYWLNPDEARRYRAENVKAAVIEETMSYADAMELMKGEKV